MRRSCILILLLCAACSKSAPPPSTPKFPVRLTTVTQKDVPIYLEALGHVDPIIRVAIRSRIEGNLTGVFFKQGQEVKQDDLLFTIDPKPYEAALKQAQSVLEENQANLSLAVEKVKRYQTLVQQEFFSQLDYESLQSSLAANVALVSQGEAEVERALVDLDYCWIYATTDGVMSILDVDLGNLVGNDQSQQLATLNQISPIYVTFSLPEIHLPEIQKHHKLACLQTKVAYENFRGETFDGTLAIINNEVDADTGMIKLRGLFDNEQKELWPGQFVRARLILRTQKDAIVIPFTAVQMTTSGPVAFVVKEQMIVERRALVLGARQDEEVVVLEGLKANETIVLEGQLNLTPGAQVFVPSGAI